MKRYRIRDIRYYEQSVDRKQFFRLPKQLYPIATRICDKLKELGFKTVGYHHVYMNLTPKLPHGKLAVQPYPRGFNDWYITVDVGFKPAVFAGLNPDQQYECVTRLTARVLLLLCRRDGLRSDLVRQTVKLVLRDRKDLEVVYLIKDTTRYRVTISYRPDLPGLTRCFVEYRDKKTKAAGKRELIKLRFPDDLHYLVASVKATARRIELKPRSSFRAGLYVRDYPRTFFRIPLKDVLESKPSAPIVRWRPLASIE